MPLPLLIILGGSAFLGAMGVCAAAEAKEIYERAKETTENAKRKINFTVQKFEDKQKSINSKVDTFQAKITKIDTEIVTKLAAFIKQIERQDELRIEFVSINNQLYHVLKDKNINIPVSNAFWDAVSSIAAGVMLSTATPTLLISLATSIGTASTGTAISTLSGVAAKNAALAWLGGGALSAGGSGIAGGLLAVNIAALGVGILIGGIVLNVKAEKAMTEAQEYSSKVDLEVTKINGKIKDLDLLEKKIDYHIGFSDRVIGIINSSIDSIKSQNMTKADVRRIINAIIIFNKYREILATDLSDKSLNVIQTISEQKINEAFELINNLNNNKKR